MTRVITGGGGKREPCKGNDEDGRAGAEEREDGGKAADGEPYVSENEEGFVCRRMEELIAQAEAMVDVDPKDEVYTHTTIHTVE